MTNPERKFTPAEDKLIRDNALNLTDFDLAALLSTHCGITRTQDQVMQHRIKNLGIRKRRSSREGVVEATTPRQRHYELEMN